MQLGYLAQVEIVGHDRRAPLFGQLDQLKVDFSQLGEIILNDLHAKQRMGLHLLQNIQAAPPALAAGIVRRIGHDLQLSVTAEGIETAAQAQLLTELGCDLGQGFHLALPTTPEHFTQLIRTGPGGVWPPGL